MLCKKAVRLLCLTALLSLIPMFVVNANAQVSRADMHEAALVVGNFGASPTDGVLRYNWRGVLIDNMVPIGTEGLIVSCCMTFGPDENLYVSNPAAGEVLRFNGVTGAFIDKFIPPGTGGLAIPLLLLFHHGYLYVGDTGAGAIRRYDAKTGAYVDNLIPDNSQGMGTFGDLQHFAFGPDHTLYVAAQISERVLKFDSDTGAFIGDFIPKSEGFSPSGLIFGPDRLMYVGSYESGEVRQYNVRTESYRVLVPARTAAPAGPVGITFGPDGKLYIAEAGPLGNGYASSAILRYDTKRQLLETLVPSGGDVLSGPRAITWKVKTTVCHHPPGNHEKSRTLRIGYLSATDHLRHGDTLGSCP